MMRYQTVAALGLLGAVGLTAADTAAQACQPEHTLSPDGQTDRYTWLCPRATTITTTATPLVPTATTAPPSTPTVTVTPTRTATPPPAAVTRLLKQYRFDSPSNAYMATSYQPNGLKAGATHQDASWGAWTVSNPGPYANWDWLPAPNLNEHRSVSVNKADYLTLQLHRPATVGIIWRDRERPGGTQPPAWLQAWTAGGTVTTTGQFAGTHQVFTKPYPAGPVQLPGPSQGTAVNSYWVLLAEQGGQVSPYPAPAPGQTAPTPNATCPSWVHDQYTTTGPDGQPYATWHPQIDPVYWCYFRHEHGSNPAYLDADWKPPFHYAAARGGFPEGHEGFKVYVMEDAGWNGYRWGFSHHFGTANQTGAACNRFHEVQLAVKRLSDNALVANLQFLADFGAGLNPSGGDVHPTPCPTQAQDARNDGSQGRRMLPVASDPAFALYDPWSADLTRNGPLGFVFHEVIKVFGINTLDPVAVCTDNTCNTMALDPARTGSRRIVTHSDWSLVAGGASSGTFYTDAYGRAVVSAGTAGAVQQYLAPGLNVRVMARTPEHSCDDWYLWGQPYVCEPLSVHNSRQVYPNNLERSLRNPN
jgi:hypothetical protein